MGGVTSFCREPSLSFIPVYMCVDALEVLRYEPIFFLFVGTYRDAACRQNLAKLGKSA